MNYAIAIVGIREAIMGFKALGFEPVPVQSAAEAVERLYAMKKERQDSGIPRYAIVFVIEDLAKEIPVEDYSKLTADALPALIAIPSHKGATGFGLTKLKRIVERAVGSDILN